MRSEDHGGNCCGITHMWNLTRYEEGSEFEESVDEFICWRMYEDGDDHSHLIEVVLTDAQINEFRGRARYLKEKGFKLVNRFLNDNSGNWCNVLHLTLKQSTNLEDSPWNKL